MSSKQIGSKKERIIYGSSLVYQEETKVKDMYMILHKPINFSKEKKYPLLIVVFGGGFVSGSPEENVTPDIASYFSKRGFLVACPNYRLARDNGLVPNAWKNYSEQNILVDKKNAAAESENLSPEVRNAAFTAVRDVKSCIRFLTKNSNKYNIDTSNVFMMGQSAGALITMATAFCPENSFFKDDSEYIKNDTTLPYNNPDIKPFKIKSYIAVSGSNQIIEQYRNVYEPSLYENKKQYPKMLIIHSYGDPVVLFTRSQQLVDKYILYNQQRNVTFVPLDNDLHVPLFNGISYKDLPLIEYIYRIVSFQIKINNDINIYQEQKNEANINNEVVDNNNFNNNEQNDEEKINSCKREVVKENNCKQDKEDDNQMFYIHVGLISLIVILLIVAIVFAALYFKLI
jgi:acetyl esterase/lipase